MFAKLRSHKLLMSLSVVGAAAGIAGLGTYATFTSTTSATHTVATGTVVIALGSPGAANRLNVSASGLVAGDTVQRAVDLMNTGSQDFASVVLTTSVGSSTLLDSDASHGLQMVIDSCDAPWTEAGTSPHFTYTCSGTTSAVLASAALIGTNRTLSTSATTAGHTDHLRVTLTLPTAADNTFQGLSDTITYKFDATQRAVTAQ